MPIDLDAVDRRILNSLQGGFPVCEHPFAAAAAPLGISEDDLIVRLRRLVDAGALSRFGPILNAPQLGGERTLAAMRVPPERFEEVAVYVDSLPAVSQNYERDHYLNMWFVIASEDPAEIGRTIAQIEEHTGLQVLDLPAEEEFFVEINFRFEEPDDLG